MGALRAVHPVLNVRDVEASAAWYIDHLGFEGRFVDPGSEPNYGGIGRDDVELHLQWHSADEWASGGAAGNVYRFLVDDPDELLAEIAARSEALRGRQVADTEWGTREFGLYDPDGNALFFYCDSPAVGS